jgi:hypothetical protein
MVKEGRQEGDLTIISLYKNECRILNLLKSPRTEGDRRKIEEMNQFDL